VRPGETEPIHLGPLLRHLRPLLPGRGRAERDPFGIRQHQVFGPVAHGPQSVVPLPVDPLLDYLRDHQLQEVERPQPQAVRKHGLRGQHEFGPASVLGGVERHFVEQGADLLHVPGSGGFVFLPHGHQSQERQLAALIEIGIRFTGQHLVPQVVELVDLAGRVEQIQNRRHQLPTGENAGRRGARSAGLRSLGGSARCDRFSDEREPAAEPEIRMHRPGDNPVAQVSESFRRGQGAGLAPHLVPILHDEPLFDDGVPRALGRDRRLSGLRAVR